MNNHIANQQRYKLMVYSLNLRKIKPSDYETDCKYHHGKYV